MVFRRCFAAALSVAAALSSTPAKDAPMPYRLRITAEYGEPLGPESLRQKLERELVAQLRVAGCFSAVDRLASEAAGQADLIVEVILDRFEQSAEHDAGVAAQHRQDADPETRHRWTASVEAVLYLQVRRAADRALVKMERSHATASQRAQPGTDPRGDAYASLVDSVVRKTRSYLCKPSLEKWQKQIRDARSD